MFFNILVGNQCRDEKCTCISSAICNDKTHCNKQSNFLIELPQTEADLPPTLQAPSHPRVSGFQEESLVNNKEFSGTQILGIVYIF